MHRADIVIGLGFGDEGKGSWVDHLVRTHGARTVVRFNGGAQAGHQVVTNDGRSHIFAQFGSGTFVPGTETLLSRFMLLEPEALLTEASVLQSKGIEHPLDLLTVSENAPVVGPYNRLLNRISELSRGDGRHGSCGFGIGETQRDIETLKGDALYMRDLQRDGGKEKMQALHRRKCLEAEALATPATLPLIKTLREIDLELYSDLFLSLYHRVRVVGDDECAEMIAGGNSVFEGAQGVLLDQCYGFFPHCTRSHCTFQNALTLLSESGFSGEVIRTGLLRGYTTRHGAGPFPTESSQLKVSPCHNHLNDWQGHFRTGWFDGVLARFALSVVQSVDIFAITNLDRLSGKGELKIATGYRGMNSFYGDGNRLTVINGNLELLRQRTSQMLMVDSLYHSVPGFEETGSSQMSSYLDSIAAACGRTVDACSASPHQKLYLPLL